MSENDFLCVRCARHQRTCCQTAEVYVSPGDQQRIEQFTGRDPAEFVEFRAPVNPVYADQDDDPVWQRHVFRADGSRRILKRLASGDCSFLGPQGCVLPLEIRPIVCRMYPYQYNADGVIDGMSTGCPTELLRPGWGLIEELGMNIDDAQRWHRQLYEELQRDNVDA